MTLSFSVLIMLIAVIIYIYDSAVFMYSDELLLARNLNGRYQCDFANHHFVMVGKLLVIQNLLLPHRPAFRVSWAPRASHAIQAGNARRVRRVSNRLLMLAPFIWLMAAALFVVAPFGLLIVHKWIIVGLALAEYYVALGLFVTILMFNNRYLQLKGSEILAITFESIVCPPCGLNFIRKISWRLRLDDDFISLSRKIMSSARYKASLQSLQSKIDQELGDLDREDPRFSILTEYNDRVRRELL